MSGEIGDARKRLAESRAEVAPPVEVEARKVLRYHYPTGPYLPTGQLDGDCKQGCGEWPCAQADWALVRIGYFTAEHIRDAGYLSPTAVREREAAAWETGHLACGCPCHQDETCLNCTNPFGGA